MRNIIGRWGKNEYTIIKELGRGGFGRVYKVADKNGREFALKVSRDVQSITREYNSMDNLNELKFIPRVYEYDDFVYKGEIYHFILMEWIKGKNLKELCLKNQLNVRHIIKIGYNIIGKMEKLKSLGYKYTDFKPENIIVDENGKIYIIDFGGVVGVEYSTKEYSPAYNIISWNKSSESYDHTMIFGISMIMISLIAKKEFNPLISNIDEIIGLLRKTNGDENIIYVLSKGISGKYNSSFKFKEDLRKLYYNQSTSFRLTFDRVEFVFVASIIFFVLSIFLGFKYKLF